MKVESVHHIALSVTELEKAKYFYGVILGLEEIQRPPFDFPGAWYRAGDRELHLIVHTRPLSLRGTTTIDSRDGHLAFRVRDYVETVEHLRAHGLALSESPRNLTPWAQIYVTDPDGNVIELNVDRSESPYA